MQEYKVRYTDRNGPTGQTFHTVFQHLCDKVSFPGIGARAWEHGWDKFFAQHNSPGISTRIFQWLGIFHMKAWRCKGIRIFTHIICTKFVSRMEILRQLQICKLLQDNYHLCQYTLFTDEATFSHAEMHNRHNEHWWPKKNPHKMKEKNFQHRFSANVWCGITWVHDWPIHLLRSP